MVSLVWVSNLTVSMIVSVRQVLLVTLLMLPVYIKGMRMAGRMGGDRVKLKGLKVVKIFLKKIISWLVVQFLATMVPSF